MNIHTILFKFAQGLIELPKKKEPTMFTDIEPANISISSIKLLCSNRGYREPNDIRVSR